MITLPRCLQSRGVVQIVVSFNKRAVIEATLRDLGVLDCFLAIHDGNDVKVVSPKYSVRTALTLRAGLQPPPLPRRTVYSQHREPRPKGTLCEHSYVSTAWMDQVSPVFTLT